MAFRYYDNEGNYIPASNYRFNPDFMPHNGWERPSYIAIFQKREREANQRELDNIRHPKPSRLDKIQEMNETLRRIHRDK